MGKIITIANQKGGVGKTTTAVNLSVSIAQTDKKVLIVDMDAQGNACTGFGIEKKDNDKSIYEVLIEGENIKDVIQKTQYKNVDIVPVNVHLSGAQVKLLKMENRESKLRQAIHSVKDDYDFIFIDCPPSLDMLTVNGLVAADSILIPLQCEFYALEGIAQLIKTIKLIKKGPNKELEIEGVILTMYDNRTNLSNQVMEEAVAYFKDKVYKTIIPRNVKLAEAPSYGKPITIYDPVSVGAKSYKKLATEIIGNN